MGPAASPGDFPAGLDPDNMLLAVDYQVHAPVLDSVEDPRIVTLTADGMLVLARRDLDSTLGTTATPLGPTKLEVAWRAIAASGVAVDRVLDLPGFAARTVTTTTTQFRVNDGRRQTDLLVHNLGSEQAFLGDPPIAHEELRLRASATALLDSLHALGGDTPWIPPALLLWWREEVPADRNATVVPWQLPVDLEAAGRALGHAVWQRCARLDGSDAAAVAEVAHRLPIDHLVERGTKRFAINLRPIHGDEVRTVVCPQGSEPRTR